MKDKNYNVVVNNHVYLIYNDDGVSGCIHLGTVHKKFRLYNPVIKARALEACQHNSQ